MTRDPLELPFDQYQRYRVVADLLGALREKGKPLVILDVGGRTANLRAFLPQDRVHLVDVEPSAEPGLVLGDGARLPFQDRAFDVVAAFDTLEHVPPPHRDAFVAECARVARRWIVLAGPYRSPAVDESERLLQRFLRDKLGVEHRYLDEHRHNGLPDLAGSSAALAKAGARTAAIGHGNLERWLPLMCVSLWLDHEPELRELAKSVFRFYNRELYASDHALPVYRHALVGALGDAPLPTAIAGLAPPQAPAGVLARFDDVLGEMVGFDRARAAWTVERERLWEMTRTLERDLAGHRESLAAERALREKSQEVARTLEVDLDGHRASVAELRATLERTRADAERTRAELAGKLTTAEAAQAASERAREDERALRARLENDVDRMALEHAALRADVHAHRELLHVERAELDRARNVVADVQRDIAEHRLEMAVRDERLANVMQELENARLIVAARDADLAGHRAMLRDVTADLEGHRGALRDARADAERTRAEVERLRAELAAVVHERDVERQRLEGAHGELAVVARSLQEQDRTITALRGDLRSRVESLRRAFGPKRPTP